MAMEITNTAGGTAYSNPFVHGASEVAHIKLDVSVLTTDEVDAYGYLKPGVPLKIDGTLVSGAGQTVYGVVFEPIKLPGRTTNTNLAADTSDPLIAVATVGLINLDLAEDNLGRAYSANELAALTLGNFKVTTT